jgi:hypothetical protein
MDKGMPWVYLSDIFNNFNAPVQHQEQVNLEPQQVNLKQAQSQGEAIVLRCAPDNAD